MESSEPAPPNPVASPPPPQQPLREQAQRQLAMRDQARESQALGAAANRAESAPLAKTDVTPEEARARANDPDTWIVRIRRLRDEGQTSAAIKELAAFRATVADAEQRVPSDLREWAATVAR